MSEKADDPHFPPERNIHLLEKESYQVPDPAPEPVREGRVSLCRVARETWAGDFHAVSPAYGVSGLFFVERGYGWFEVEQQVYAVRGPQILLYPKSRPRRFWCRRTDPWKVWIVEMRQSGGELEQLAGHASGNWKAPELLMLFRRCLELAREGDWQACSTYAEVILRELRHHGPVPNVPPTAAEALAADFQGLLCTADLRKITSPEEAARRLQVPRRRLSLACRSVFGEPVGPLLCRARMRLAESRLAESGALVKETAAEFGFADAFAFSRAFQRELGYPPSRVILGDAAS